MRLISQCSVPTAGLDSSKVSRIRALRWSRDAMAESLAWNLPLKMRRFAVVSYDQISSICSICSIYSFCSISLTLEVGLARDEYLLGGLLWFAQMCQPVQSILMRWLLLKLVPVMLRLGQTPKCGFQNPGERAWKVCRKPSVAGCTSDGLPVEICLPRRYCLPDNALIVQDGPIYDVSWICDDVWVTQRVMSAHCSCCQIRFSDLPNPIVTVFCYVQQTCVVQGCCSGKC
jgi:hypothetical protein